MPKIRCKEIVDFKENSSRISPDELHPINSFIRIDWKDNYCTVTKNGMIAFIKKNIPSESKLSDGSILVSEDKLFNIATDSKSDTIEIIRSEKGIKLTSGSIRSNINTDDVAKFQFNEVPTSGWKKIYLQAITTFENAVNFILDDPDKAAPQCCNIFCKGNTIVACNGFIAFFKKLQDEIPELILRKEVIQAIRNMPGAEYASNSSYDFFKAESTLYGFSKHEIPFYDMSQFGQMESNDLSFFINKTDLISFNNICIKSSKSELINVKFQANSLGQLDLLFENPDSGIYDLMDTIETKNATVGYKNGHAYFKYNPHVMNNLLKSVPSTMVYFYPGKNKYYITDEEKTFVSLIMGLI